LKEAADEEHVQGLDIKVCCTILLDIPSEV